MYILVYIKRHVLLHHFCVVGHFIPELSTLSPYCILITDDYEIFTSVLVIHNLYYDYINILVYNFIKLVTQMRLY